MVPSLAPAEPWGPQKRLNGFCGRQREGEPRASTCHCGPSYAAGSSSTLVTREEKLSLRRGETA